MAVIKLVRGDTRPTLVMTVRDATTDLPLNLTGATVRLKFRQVVEEGVTPVLKATIVCTITDAPNGALQAVWPATALDTAGNFEGEIEVTFPDTTVQTVYDKLKFLVREDF